MIPNIIISIRKTLLIIKLILDLYFIIQFNLVYEGYIVFHCIQNCRLQKIFKFLLGAEFFIISYICNHFRT